jgi:hypothetical protein
MSARAQQVGGDHYKSLPIEPIDYIVALTDAGAIGWHEGNAIKYLSRWRSKNGLQDLRKAAHYIAMLIEREEGLSRANKVLPASKASIGDAQP